MSKFECEDYNIIYVDVVLKEKHIESSMGVAAKQYTLLKDTHFYILVTKEYHDGQVTMERADFVVPKGFKWDGASIPRYIFWIRPADFRIPALFHDYLYSDPDNNTGKRISSHLELYTVPDDWHKIPQRYYEESRFIADNVFLKVGGKLAYLPSRKNMQAYWGVRVGGKKHYKGKDFMRGAKLLTSEGETK